MRSGSRCPAFYGEISPMRWGILGDDGGYFYCITYTMEQFANLIEVLKLSKHMNSPISQRGKAV